MLENGSSKDLEQVRVELHNDELIVRRDAGRRNTNRPLKNVCLCLHIFVFLYFALSVCRVAFVDSLFIKI